MWKYFVWCLDMRESGSQQGLLKPKKKIGVTMHFLRDNAATIILRTVKYKAMYGVFFFFPN